MNDEEPRTETPVNLRVEAVGWLIFLTVVYIVVVNPSILSADGATGISFSGALTATVLVCFVMTLLMGVYASCCLRWRRGWGRMRFLLIR